MKIILLILASLSLTSCSLYYGLKQTDPNRKAPGVIERWWNDQQPKP